MPTYPDITPSWLKPENASVLDSPLLPFAVAGASGLGRTPHEQLLGQLRMRQEVP